MVDDQQEPQENTDSIQVSDQAPEQDQIQTDDVDNAPGEEGQKDDRVTFSPEQQAIFNDTVGKKVAKTHEVQRQMAEQKRELDELKAALPKAKEPVIPAMPNPEDFVGDPEGLTTKMQERDEAFRNRAKFDEEQKTATTQAQQQAFQQQQVQLQKQSESIAGYKKTAETFGIKEEQVMREGTFVNQAGLSPQVQDHLLADPQGPLITSFLTKNIAELDKVLSMDPLTAAVYIQSEIKPQLAGTDKSTKAPKPADIVGGQGSPDKVPDSIKGATFE